MNKKGRIMRKTRGCCAHCGKKLNKSSITFDHFVTQSVGGTWNEDNLFPLCAKCNRMRGSDEINPYTYYRFADPYYIRLAENYKKVFVKENTPAVSFNF